jgi:hypothetical protein
MRLVSRRNQFDKMPETMTTPSKPPTSSRAKPSSESFAGPVSFTVHHSKSTLYRIPTTCGDIQQKKCALDRPMRGKSTESTFPSHFSNRSIFPRDAQNTFRSNSIYFPFTKCISNSNNDFDQSHLTPMITLQINPENQISSVRRGRIGHHPCPPSPACGEPSRTVSCPLTYATSMRL